MNKSNLTSLNEISFSQVSKLGKANITNSQNNSCLNNQTVYFEACEDSFEIKEKEKGNLKFGKNSVFIRKIRLPSLPKSQNPNHSQIENLSNHNNNIINLQLNISNYSPNSEYQDCSECTKSQVLSSFMEGQKALEILNNPFSFSPPKYSKSSINYNDNYNNSVISDKRNLLFKNLSMSNSLRISMVQFDNIKDGDININFLLSKLRHFNVKIKGNINNSNRHFRTLIELQNFYIDKSPIWIVKFSYDGKYLATGSKGGIIKILEVMNFEYDDFKLSYSKNEILSYLHFVQEHPKYTLNSHSSDVIDLSWSNHIPSYLLSASLDHYVILWDISNEHSQFIRKFEHDDMVTCVAFSPLKQNLFISGCFDRIVRIWTIDKDDKYEYFNIKEKITTIAFFPSGDMIAIGTHNGKVIIYNIGKKISYNCSFSFKKKMGLHAFGKKVTNIEFVNKNKAIISNADNRIRYVTMPDGKVIRKFKGPKIEELMIRAHYFMMYDLIISGSENGNCYIWNKNTNEKDGEMFEFFKPFSKDIVECSLFVNEECMAGYLKKFYKLTTKLLILSIIVIATDQGRIQILINVEESI